MPEGDTIHRSARRLASAIQGRAVVEFQTPRLVGAGPAPGTVIDAVEARGKYLTIRFGDGLVLETHLKMTGSWHLYRRGERWRRSRAAARVVVGTDEWVAVCFNAPHVRMLSTGAEGARGRTRADGPDHLGPDLCEPDPDFELILARLDEPQHQRRPLVDVLLDQRLFCGVGNVFKSEVLAACVRHPLEPLGSVPIEVRRKLVETAHAQLRANLGRGRRETVPGGLAVYGREGSPCRRCGAGIEVANLGRHLRPTFWCPMCQPSPRVEVGDDA